MAEFGWEALGQLNSTFTPSTSGLSDVVQTSLNPTRNTNPVNTAVYGIPYIIDNVTFLDGTQLRLRTTYV
jgi:hypothetical protein